MIFIGIAIIIAGSIVGITLEKVASAIDDVGQQINILASSIREDKQC